MSERPAEEIAQKKEAGAFILYANNSYYCCGLQRLK